MEKFSDLPQDILYSFAERLESIEDLVRFGGVCKSWQSVFVKQKGQKRNFAPMLMLSTSERKNTQPFFSFSSNKLFRIQLPQIRGRKCWGSPFGWLATIGLDLNIHLFNPFSRAQLSLPPQPTFSKQFKCARTPRNLRETFIEKIVLSSNPSDSAQACVAMAIHGELRSLAFAKPGEEAWTTVESHLENNQDVIFYNGQFYAITCRGHLMVCAINIPNPKATLLASPPVFEANGLDDCLYLVEMSGELHFVQRFLDGDDDARDFHFDTLYFEVHKFDFHTKTWTESHDLGHHALFLGTNTSFAISTLNYPQFKRNSIYFTDDHYGQYKERFCDMGVYELEEEEEGEGEGEDEDTNEDEFENNTKPIFSGNYGNSRFSRPLFVMPSFC